MEEMKCQNCGEVMEPHPNNCPRKYCSHACRYAKRWENRKNSPEYQEQQRRRDKARRAREREARQARKAQPKPEPVVSDSEAYFWSLVKPKAKIKRRKCLRCSTLFETTPENRICSQCTTINARKHI